MTPAPLTSALGAFTAAVGREGTPADARAAALTGFIDTCATTIAGRREAAVQVMLGALALPAGRAPLFFGERTTDASTAALLNGTAAHALDYDDVALRGHPSAVLVSAILALGAETGASGTDMLDAYVAGYEVWADLVDREADIHHVKGWHPTGIFGAIGASAAACVLLRLDAGQCAHALGLGASQSAGVMSNFGAMAKPFHVGRAAQAGVLAARLAAAGFTASADALEHPQGFLAAVSPHGRVERERPAAAGQPFQITGRRANVKRYPLCYYTHRALDGMLALRARHGLRPDQVAQVEVRMSREHATVLRNHRPGTGLAAKFSIEFAMASALCNASAGLADLADERVQAAEVQRLMALVTVATIPADDPQTPGAAYADQVIVTLRDGSRLEGEPVHQALGHAQRPLDRAQLRAKFSDALAYGGYAGDGEELFERLAGLDGRERVFA